MRLLLITAAALAVWLGALPRLGAQRTMRETIERHEALGIDASAKFYSDLPGMQGIVERVESAHRREGEAFWRTK